MENQKTIGETNEIELSMEDLELVSGGTTEDGMPALPKKSSLEVMDFSTICMDYNNNGKKHYSHFCFNCTQHTYKMTHMYENKYLIEINCIPYNTKNTFGGWTVK